MNDLISRQAAIEWLIAEANAEGAYGYVDTKTIVDCLNSMPLAQAEQTKMIKEIREWINSENRGSADYFIVDKIEEIINKYE